MWAISCYFNPCRYARRLHNHRLFRERLGIPLVTVELSHDGDYELDAVDADRLVRLHAPDVLWQKERLLNLAVDALPGGCDRVAWFDGDVFLGRDDWALEASERLDDVAMLQLFSHCVDLPRDVADARAGAEPTGRGFLYLYEQGGHEAELFDALWGSDVVSTEVKRRLSSGFAWAARRDLLEAHGLYDGCVLGSGDRAIAVAACGRASTASLNFLRSEAQRRHYLAWAEPFAAAVAGRVSYVEGTVYHLWHGELRDRRYRERWRDLAAFEFDPESDIAHTSNGPWRWNSDKPAMHDYVRSYFGLRREDGA